MKNIFYKKKDFSNSGSLSIITWRKFRKDKLSMGSLIIVCVAVMIALLGYLVTPDSTPYANEQHIEIAAKKPGFSITMIKIRKNKTETKINLFHKMLFGKESNYTEFPIYSWHFENSEIVFEDFTGDTPNDGTNRRYNIADIYNNENNISISGLKNKFEKENIYKRTFLLGTDRYGRDMLSQLIIGSRVSLSVGFISVIISLVIGILLGALAGFFRRWVDNLIMWFINVVWSIPTLLLVIAITFALGKGFWQVFIAIGLTMWVDVARMVRGQILGIREKEFVEAGRALGFKNSRIIFRHILPNVMGAVIVISASNFSSAILVESGLSFLGIGVQPPMPSWGTMIKEHYPYIILDSAHLAILPGIAIMIMVLAFMLIGNGLRDALDTRSAK